jgi:hypothetical protein
LFSKQLERVTNFQVLLPLLLFVFTSQIQAQTVTPNSEVIESGKFRLHKFEQPIGEETYEIARR